MCLLGRYQITSLRFTEETHLDKEFPPPIVKIIKGFLDVHVMYKDTAIRTTVESNTKYSEIFRVLLYLRSANQISCYIPSSKPAFLKRSPPHYRAMIHRIVEKVTCRVKSLSSNWISFVKKSAPTVALYCLLNFLLTYLEFNVKDKTRTISDT